MGNHGSSNCDVVFSNSLDAYYAKTFGKSLTGLNVGVKGGSVVGGSFSNLADYGNSVYSSAKEKLIREIAEDLSSSLHINSSYARTAPIKDVVAKLQRIVPDPKNKKSIKADASIHKTICKSLAASINKRYGVSIIDEDADIADICQKVGEIMYSLFTGLHTEFLSVSGDISRIIKNLQVLQEYVNAANKRFINEVSKSSNKDSLSGEMQNVTELYNKLTEEINRQHALLTNLTNSVIGPVGKSLIGLLDNNPSFARLTDDLKRVTGNTYFGEKLSYLLSGINDVAHAADLVNNSLKKIGMSVSEYRNVKNISDLRNKVYANIVKKKPSSAELRKLLVAADIIYKNDMAHDDIASYLEKKRGGFDDTFGDMTDDSTWSESVPTPFDGRTQSYRNSISKQIKEQHKYKKLLFNDFNRQIKASYMEIIFILDKISKKFTTDLSNPTEVEEFIRLLNSFARTQPERSDIHLALSGHKSDSTSLYVKNQYMDYLYNISEELQKLVSTRKLNESYSSLLNAFNKLIKTVDDFNINFNKEKLDREVTISKIGQKNYHAQDGGDGDRHEHGHNQRHKHHKHHKHHHKNKDHHHKPNNLDEHDQNEDEFDLNSSTFGNEESQGEESQGEESQMREEEEEESKGSGDSDEESTLKVGGNSSYNQYILGGVSSEFSPYDFKHFISLKGAIKKLDYYYRIGNIKTRLNQLASEGKEYSENYNNILGEEAGFLIDNIQKRYNALLADANGQTLPQGCGYTTYKQLYQQSFIDAPGGPGYHGVTNAFMMGDIKSLKDMTIGVDVGWKDYVDGYKFLIEYIKTAKIEMIEAAQSLDIYLSKFTRDIQMKPDTIHNFTQIVEQLEVVVKWFNNKSGDNFVSVFESFDNDVTNIIDGKAFTANGVNNLNTAKAFNNPGGNTQLRDVKINDDSHYYDQQIRNNYPGLFYKPRLMTKDAAIEFVKRIEKSIKSVRALENIVNIFSKLNIIDNKGVKTFMSPASMFKAFMKYCVASVISVGWKVVSVGNDNNRGAGHRAHNFIFIDKKAFIDFRVRNLNNITAGAQAGTEIPNDVAAIAVTKMAVGLRFNTSYIRISDEKRRDDGQYDNAAGSLTPTFLHLCDPLELDNEIHVEGETTCDKLFQMCIKSMVAKIFTVIGTYSLFNKVPKTIESNNTLSINPLRQILGGAEHSTGGSVFVDIIPEATELYLRLPLLVEWYREVFEFNKTTGNQENKSMYNKQSDPLVSIVPEMDNIWGDICKIIFIDNRNIGDGTYPSEQARKIINSVTDIYTYYKNNKKSSCKEILEDFIMEVNRKYGFMLRSEINEYLKIKKEEFKYYTYDQGEDVSSYDLLNTNDEYGRGIIPSDNFRSYSVKDSGNNKVYEWNNFDNAVKRFRYSIENNLLLDNELSLDDLEIKSGNPSLNDIVRLTKKRINNASSNEERYRIIHEQLHGIEKFGDVDQNKLLVFHETVITPLTILYFVYLIVNNYNKFMVTLNMENFNDAISYYIAGTAADDGLIEAFNGPDPGVNPAAGVPEGESALHISQILLNYNNKKFKDENSPFKRTDRDDTMDSIGNVDMIVPYIHKTYDGAIVDFGAIYGSYLIDTTNPHTLRQLLGNGAGAAVPVEEQKMVLRRFLLNRSKLMEDTLRHMIKISTNMDNLVDISFSGQGKERYPMVNFDKLEEICTELLQGVKQSLSRLRKYIPYTLVKSVEESKVNGVNNIISIFWLQENLFDRLFANKFGNGLSDANNGLKNIWRELTRKHEFNWHCDDYRPVRLDMDGTVATRPDGTPATALAGDIRRKTNNQHEPGVAPYDSSNAATTDEQKRINKEYCEQFYYDSYNDVISKLTFWDVTMPKNNVFFELGLRVLNLTNEINEFPAHYVEIYNSGGTVGVPKTKIERDELNHWLSTTPNLGSVAGDSKKAFNFNHKIVTLMSRVDGAAPATGADVSLNLFLGCHNLYDYKTDYSYGTNPIIPTLVGGGAAIDAGYDVEDKNLGGLDRYAPGTTQDVLDTIPGGEKLYKKLGLLSTLTNIIYNYFRLFIDPTNNKIYKTLVEKFVNSHNSKDILQNKNINDRVVCAQDFRDLKDKTDGKFYPPSLNAKADSGGGAAAAAAASLVSAYTITARALNEINRVGAARGAGGAVMVHHICSIVPAVCQLEPPPGAVLFASLSNGIKGLTTLTVDKSTGTTLKYVDDNFNNITDFQKELMRAYLPVFEKHLNMVSKQASFIKSIIENTSCKVYKWKQHRIVQRADATHEGLFSAASGELLTYSKRNANARRIIYQELEENTPNYTQPLKAPIVESEGTRKTYLINMLNDIATTAKSLNNCVALTMKDLSDIPIYLEMYKDSIIDYNARNSKLPFMPFSSITHLMNLNVHRINKIHATTSYKNEDDVHEEDSSYVLQVMPSHYFSLGGHAQMKFAYATRGVLSSLQNPSIEYLPGMMSMLNAKFGGSTGVDSNSNLMMKNSILLSRFIIDYEYHAQYLTDKGYNEARLLINENQTANGNREIKNLSCQTGKVQKDRDFWSSTENILLLSENDNIKQPVYRLISCLQPSSGKISGAERKIMRIYNIIEMGCVPLNVHALNREVPFINLMNYSYSFDNFVKNLIGIDYKNKPLSKIHGYSIKAINQCEYLSTIQEDSYSNSDFNELFYPEDALVRHLIYPNGYRRLREYVNFVYKIFSGNTSLGLNRPKFLSDQLWNKVLLNTLYDNDFISNNNKVLMNESRRQSDIKQVVNKSNYHTLLSNILNHMDRVQQTDHRNAARTIFRDQTVKDVIDLTLTHRPDESAIDTVIGFMYGLVNPLAQLIHAVGPVGAVAAANAEAFVAAANGDSTIAQYGNFAAAGVGAGGVTPAVATAYNNYFHNLHIYFPEIKNTFASNELLNLAVSGVNNLKAVLSALDTDLDTIRPGCVRPELWSLGQICTLLEAKRLSGAGANLENPFTRADIKGFAQVFEIQPYTALAGIGVGPDTGDGNHGRIDALLGAESVARMNPIMKKLLEEIAAVIIKRVGSPGLSIEPRQGQVSIGTNDNNMITADNQELFFLGLNSDYLRNKIQVNPYILLRNLSYVDNKGVIKNINILDSKYNHIGLEGYLRYNTKFIRWNEWFIQLQRCIRIILRKELESTTEPVSIQQDVLDDQFTDYDGTTKEFNVEDYE